MAGQGGSRYTKQGCRKSGFQGLICIWRGLEEILDAMLIVNRVIDLIMKMNDNSILYKLVI